VAVVFILLILAGASIYLWETGKGCLQALRMRRA
jgi:hypothetical protein